MTDGGSTISHRRMDRYIIHIYIYIDYFIRQTSLYISIVEKEQGLSPEIFYRFWLILTSKHEWIYMYIYTIADQPTTKRVIDIIPLTSDRQLLCLKESLFCFAAFFNGNNEIIYITIVCQMVGEKRYN